MFFNGLFGVCCFVCFRCSFVFFGFIKGIFRGVFGSPKQFLNVFDGQIIMKHLVCSEEKPSKTSQTEII